MQKRASSFRFAYEGILYVMRTQRNAWIHMLASVAVIITGLWLRLSRIEWSILVITMTLVWTAEFANTALETLVDLASPETHPLAKVAKDVAAGAVLVTACGAMIVGLLILGPPLWQIMTGS